MYFYKIESYEVEDGYIDHEKVHTVYLIRKTKCEDFEALCQSLFESIAYEKLEVDKQTAIKKRQEQSSDLPPVVLFTAHWGESMDAIIDKLCEEYQFCRLTFDSEVSEECHGKAITNAPLGLRDGEWHPCKRHYDFMTDTETVEWEDR
jgi:hypothetical protein